MASFQDDRGLNGDYHDRGSCMLCLEMEQLQKRKEEHQISTGDGLLFTRNCKFCAGRLFYKSSRVYEPHGQCCGPNGKYRAKLEEYDPRIFEPIPWEIQEHWRTKIDLRQRTRKYQQLFCISSIGTNTLGRKGFETHHPGGITLHGATYHVVRNPDESCAGNKRNPLHWLLYDSDERGNQDPAYGPPIAEDFIQSMQSLLSKHNAVVHGFEFVDPNDCVGKTMTLRRTPGGTSEVAVLIGEEARGFDPREIVIKRADGVHAQIPAKGISLLLLRVLLFYLHLGFIEVELERIDQLLLRPFSKISKISMGYDTPPKIRGKKGDLSVQNDFLKSPV